MAKPLLIFPKLKRRQWLDLGEQEPLLTFLQDAEVWRVLDLTPLSEPLDPQRRGSSDPALQDHHLALGRCCVLQLLEFEKNTADQTLVCLYAIS